MSHEDQIASTLRKYVPEAAIPLLLPLMRRHPLMLKVSRTRKTKLGDYRFPDASGRHRISVNHDLNSYAFLITLLHELAHLFAFEEHGRRIKPHGMEWQVCFRDIAYPFLENKLFPTTLQQLFIESLNRGYASSCTDLKLHKALRAYDENIEDKTYVEDLPMGSIFAVNDKAVFKKGPKLRKRYKCLNLKNGREYMVHPMALTISHKKPPHE